MYDAVRSVVEPKWSLEILVTLCEESPQNFSTITEQFDTSNDVITDRLRLLVNYGLVERTEHTSRDVRYSITDCGTRFLKELAELDRLFCAE